MTKRIIYITFALVFITALSFAGGKNDAADNAGSGTTVQPKGNGSYGFIGGELQESEGLLITGVLVDGPAEKAGIERGDILLAVDGSAVNTQADVLALLAGKKAGDTIELKIKHGSETKDVSLTIEERLFRNPLGLVFGSGSGMSIIPSTPMGEYFFGRGGNNGFRSFMPMSEYNGAVVVAEVAAGGPAEKAGVKTGDIITAVDSQKLTTFDSLKNYISSRKPGDSVALSVRRVKSDNSKETEELTITAVLGASDDGGALLGVQYGTIGSHWLTDMPDNMRKYIVPRTEKRQNGTSDDTPQADSGI